MFDNGRPTYRFSAADISLTLFDVQRSLPYFSTSAPAIYTAVRHHAAGSRYMCPAPGISRVAAYAHQQELRRKLGWFSSALVRLGYGRDLFCSLSIEIMLHGSVGGSAHMCDVRSTIWSAVVLQTETV
jgi:hypothetical protein